MLGEVWKPIGIASSQVVSDCTGSWSHEGDSTLIPPEISPRQSRRERLYSNINISIFGEATYEFPCKHLSCAYLQLLLGNHTRQSRPGWAMLQTDTPCSKPPRRPNSINSRKKMAAVRHLVYKQHTSSRTILSILESSIVLPLSLSRENGDCI